MAYQHHGVTIRNSDWFRSLSSEFVALSLFPSICPRFRRAFSFFFSWIFTSLFNYTSNETEERRSTSCKKRRWTTHKLSPSSPFETQASYCRVIITGRHLYPREWCYFKFIAIKCHEYKLSLSRPCNKSNRRVYRPSLTLIPRFHRRLIGENFSLSRGAGMYCARYNSEWRNRLEDKEAIFYLGAARISSLSISPSDKIAHGRRRRARSFFIFFFFSVLPLIPFAAR